MVTLGDSLVSSSARRLTIRKRPDLSAQKQYYLGKTYWVVKEPVGLNYFRFEEEEYTILQMLDGLTSLDEIKERFEGDFPPQKITLEELQQFIGMLHRSGLVIADVPGQGPQLHKRRGERRRKELLNAFANILCIRFRGFDPERVLNRLYPFVRWCFSPVFITLCLVFAASAATLVIVEFDVFRSKLPAFHQFFSKTNALWLAISLGVTKAFHEFGHGMTCKHFGGECHEMGVMILVLTPCPYCNVSDSWMLPNKWHRAAIGAAGMFVEIVLASIATYIWWFTMPGLLNNLCLNVMFIASVTTVVFNANPLLRYDGYYILADLAEIPNLRQKATTILSHKMGELMLGMEPPEDPFLPQRNQIFFALYSVAAAVYRWVVLASILWFLFRVFKPYRLEIIGRGIVFASLVGLVVMPLYQLAKFFYIPGRTQQVKKPRMYTSLAVIGVILLAVFVVPLPHSVICSLEIQPRDARSVYVDVPGRLEHVDVKPGDHVKEGQLLATLSDVDVDLQIAQLTGERDQYQRELLSLRRQQFRSDQAAAALPTTKQALDAKEKELLEKQADEERLELRAPIAGTVFPPPYKPRRKDSEGQLPDWAGMPMDPENLGCFLPKNTMFCQVGDPQKMQAMLVIDQADVDYLCKDQRVEIKLDALPFDTLWSTVAVLPTRDIRITPQRLSTKAGGELPTVTDASGTERPQSTSYPAFAYLDNSDGMLRIGLRGRAKIHTSWQTLSTRLWRLVQQTLNFRL